MGWTCTSTRSRPTLSAACGRCEERDKFSPTGDEIVLVGAAAVFFAQPRTEVLRHNQRLPPGADLDLPGDQANGHEELNRGLEQLLSPTSGGGVHICASRVAWQPATLNKATRKSNEPHADSLDWHRNGGDGFQRPTHQPRTERASGRRRAWASSVDESGSRGSGSEDNVCNECVQCVKCVQCVQCRD